MNNRYIYEKRTSLTKNSQDKTKIIIGVLLLVNNNAHKVWLSQWLEQNCTILFSVHKSDIVILKIENHWILKISINGIII